MKLNCWLILGTMLSTSLLAQQATNTPSAATNPPSAPAPVIETPAPAATPAPALTNAAAAPAPTNAPAAKKKADKKAPAKKKAAAPKSAVKAAPKKAPVYETSTRPLVAGPATVVASNVNVRGQAKLNSEVVTKVTKGQELTVLEEIVHNNSGPTEPSAWAKILLPPGSTVWVHSSFINPDKTVKPNRLKLRSGPGENYSMLGIIDHGQSVKDLATKGDWMKIEAPSNAYAFVAAQYLKQEAPGAIAAATTPAATAPPLTEPPTTAAVVAENPPVAAPPSEPTTPPVAADTNAPSVAENALTNALTTASNTETNPPEAKPEEPLPPRIVAHEGVVRGMTSIQAPSHFELISADNGRLINYLHTTSTNLDLRRYKGLHVVVTGEEGLDERWGNTPVLTLQSIHVVDDKSQ